MTTQPGANRLAVIDTDSGFIRVLTKRLEVAGWQHRVLSTPVAPEELVAMKLNAIVIDTAVLGTDAWDYLERVCGMLPELGVVVCTGQSTVAQRVRGLRLGADDWVGKPCHPEEVIARLEAVVRRRRRSRIRSDVGPLIAGELEIRPDQFQAFVGGRSLELTRREFELLQLLAEGKGNVLEREAIYQRVWGYSMAHGDRSVDVFVRKLRQKLERVIDVRLEKIGDDEYDRVLVEHPRDVIDRGHHVRSATNRLERQKVPDDAQHVPPPFPGRNDVLDAVIAFVEECEWNDRIELQPPIAELGLKPGKVMHLVYTAVEGASSGLPLFESIGLLGSERTLRRLEAARARLAGS